jgi:prolyl oligopeptidase
MTNRMGPSALICLLWVMASALAAEPPTAPALPATPKQPVTDRYFDTKVIDEYRWLENGSDPAVRQWSAAQEAYAQHAVSSLPQYAPLKQKLTALTRGASASFGGLTVAGNKIFAYYSDPKAQQASLVMLNESADPASRQTVLDPNRLDAKGLTTIDWFVPSHDGRMVAVSLSKNGSEDGTLHIYETAGGKEIGEPIPAVQYPTAGGSLAWAADGKGFWYTRYPGDAAPEADRHFFMQTYFHTLGKRWQDDLLVLGTADGLPRIAEIFLENAYAPELVLASVQKGDGGEWQQWLLKPDGSKAKVADFADRIVAARIGPDRALYMISLAGAPNGKVLKLQSGNTRLSAAKTIVAAGDAAIQISANQEALVFAGERLYVNYIAGGPNVVRSFNLDGTQALPLPLPEISAFSNLVALDQGELLVKVASYLKPDRYVRFIAATQRILETKLAKQSPVNFDDAEVVRLFAKSKDGTKVPINVIRKRGTVLNGKNPTLLYGYGGYGINQQPHFGDVAVRLWLDAGGVYTEANIRGGAEYGERWHQEGNLTRKQNVFDDFAACGQALIDQRYTDSAHLALRGGSNGGLLMGAMITQHPQLARAVVAQVGIYDMLRVELDANGVFNTTEYGSVKDPEQFKALYAYSPYHHVVAGTQYPAVLMTTGANDGRVNPMQSRKFTAALQAANASKHPILLRVSSTSGHGVGSSVSERIDQSATWLSFLFDQLGMQLPPSTRSEPVRKPG